jgi:hypothetical protein
MSPKNHRPLPDYLDLVFEQWDQTLARLKSIVED